MSAVATAPRRAGRFARFTAFPGATAGAIMLALIFGAALFAPWIAPYGWNEIGVAPSLSPPSAACWFGTDLYGRDIFRAWSPAGAIRSRSAC